MRKPWCKAVGLFKKMQIYRPQLTTVFANENNWKAPG
jgi:hypothetical protein